MKKITFLFAFLLATFGGTRAWADELTVADGTNTNNYVPFMGQNADYGVKGEYVIPAASLSVMNGKSITSLKLYVSTNNTSTKPNYGPFQVFLKEVDNATPYTSSSSAFQGMTDATIVYEGTIVASSGEMLITFTDNYTYNGGNLLVGFYKDKGGNYLANSFKGVNQDGYTANSTYSSSGISSISTGTGRTFIPKTTFTYEAASPYKKPATLLFSDVTYSSAKISWTAGSTDNSETGWDLEYKTSVSDTWTGVHGLDASTLSYTLNTLTDNTSYDVRVKALYGANESEWKTTSFKTPIAPITSFPWSEDFNSLTVANTIPDGWDNSDGTTTNNSYKWCYNTATSGNGATNGTGHDGKCIRFESYNNSSNNTNFLKTPIMSFPTGAAMQLKFWYKNPKGGDFSVYISNDGGTTYTTELATGLKDASAWTEKVVDIPSEFVNNVVIVFKGTSNYGSGDANIYLDDVLVKENAAYAMSISGTDVVSNTIAFGEVKNTSTTKTFTISNDGASDLTGVSVVSSDVTVFTVSETGFDIAAGATKDITVTFVKGVEGNYSETITVSQANIATPLTLDVTGSYATPSAAAIVVKDGENAVGETVAFGNVGKAKTKTITIANTGEADLVISSITSSNTTDFTVSPSSLTVQGGNSGTFTVTFLYDANALNVEKTATITVTPSNEGLNPVVFTVSGTRIEKWSEDFSGNALPTGWDAGANWSFTNGVAKAAYVYGTTNYLTTPTLTVTDATDELTFDYVTTAGNVNIAIQMSKDGGAWETCAATPAIPTYMSNGTEGTATITGLEAGTYQFRFANDDYELDNFEGFKLNLPDHMATITVSSIPESSSWNVTMKENRSFEAYVTVKELRGVAEALTAKLYMGTEVIGTGTGTVAANGTETLTITATPTVAAVDGVQMHFEVEWAGTTLTTEPVTRYVAALTYLTLDETSSDAIVAGTYDNVTLKRQFVAGWNTVCLPFTINDVEGFFGAGAKAYDFSAFANGELSFSNATTLTASYPYIVYVPAAITDDIVVTDITITNNTSTADNRFKGTYPNYAYFRGTYAPVAAGAWTKKADTDIIYGVTSAGKIAKAGANASIDGFRAYFDLPASASSARLTINFGGEATGIATIENGELKIENVYNLNGQRVQNVKRGNLYIVNGKKQLVK